MDLDHGRYDAGKFELMYVQLKAFMKENPHKKLPSRIEGQRDALYMWLHSLMNKLKKKLERGKVNEVDKCRIFKLVDIGIQWSNKSDDISMRQIYTRYKEKQEKEQQQTQQAHQIQAKQASRTPSAAVSSKALVLKADPTAIPDKHPAGRARSFPPAASRVIAPAPAASSSAPSTESFDQRMLKELQDFYQSHGHSKVLLSSGCDPKLAFWVEDQKNKWDAVLNLKGERSEFMKQAFCQLGNLGFFDWKYDDNNGHSNESKQPAKQQKRPPPPAPIDIIDLVEDDNLQNLVKEEPRGVPVCSSGQMDDAGVDQSPEQAGIVSEQSGNSKNDIPPTITFASRSQDTVTVGLDSLRSSEDTKDNYEYHIPRKNRLLEIKDDKFNVITPMWLLKRYEGRGKRMDRKCRYQLDCFRGRLCDHRHEPMPGTVPPMQYFEGNVELKAGYDQNQRRWWSSGYIDANEFHWARGAGGRKSREPGDPVYWYRTREEAIAAMFETATGREAAEYNTFMCRRQAAKRLGASHVPAPVKKQRQVDARSHTLESR